VSFVAFADHIDVPSLAVLVSALLFCLHIHSFCDSHYQNSSRIKQSVCFLYHFIKSLIFVM